MTYVISIRIVACWVGNLSYFDDARVAAQPGEHKPKVTGRDVFYLPGVVTSIAGHASAVRSDLNTSRKQYYKCWPIVSRKA
jgi:hypothetical protein